MSKFIILSLVVFYIIICFIYSVQCDNQTLENNLSVTKNSTNLETARRRKVFHGIWWYSALHAIAAIITIKLKIVLLFMFVVGSIFYGLKVWQGKALGCPEPVIQEDHILPYSAYAPAGHSFVSSYPGPEPWTNYASSYGADHYSTLPDSSPSVSNAYLPPSKRKSYNTKGSSRDFKDDETSGFGIKQMEELFFGFLGVNTRHCRKRFICEMEFRTKKNPLVQFIFGRISDTIFKDYRILSEKEDVRPKKFTDCALRYNECRAPFEQNVGIEVSDKFKNRRKFRTTTSTEATIDTSPSENSL